MRTTFDLDDALFIAAKKAAAERRCTLRQLVQTALRKEIEPRTMPQPGWTRRLRKYRAPAGLAPDLDVSSRGKMYDWLDRHGGAGSRGR